MDELPVAIGRRVREARSARGLTLDQLAEASGVSRRMIVNVESGASNASIATLLRLARALQVSLADLVSETPGQARVLVTRRADQQSLWTGPSGGSAVLVASANTPDMLELWTWTVQPGESYASDAHRPGTYELLHVIAGSLSVRIADEEIVLRSGDSLRLVGDVPHTYANDTQRPVRFTMAVWEPGTRGRP